MAMSTPTGELFPRGRELSELMGWDTDPGVAWVTPGCHYTPGDETRGGWRRVRVAHGREMSFGLALVLVLLCAGVGVVAVGRLADGLVALDERAER